VEYKRRNSTGPYLGVEFGNDDVDTSQFATAEPPPHSFITKSLTLSAALPVCQS
jgi:hypothetical protein